MLHDDSFGQRLKQRRKTLEFTQDDLARRVGCAVVTIRKIESGELRPSRLVAERLADQLQVPEAERAAFIAHARGEVQIRRSNLPAPTTSLVGRAAELARAHEVLRSDARLLTLTGTPGIGKTRLGLQLAHELQPAFPDGVFFVSLTSISDHDLVLSTIAQTLGLPERWSPPIQQQLVDFLHDKQLLLLLDNFEHVLASAAQIADLLTAAPKVMVIITSRAVLHLSGEHVLLVPPLDTPASQPAEHAAAERLTALAEYPSVALFLERARAASPTFKLTKANAQAIADICIGLEGIPLAIELAAARVRVFSPPALLARLERRLTVLTGGAHDLPTRQQTLRGTIDWSYQLLEPDDQAVFRKLACFVGGWSLEAAEAVCAPQPDAPARPLLDSIESLLNQSLIQSHEDATGESRFTMLETIREYALEQLHDSGQYAAARQRHSAFFTAFASAAEPQLQGADQLLWLNRLETDHGNLRAAMEWSRTPGGDPQHGLMIAGSIWIFWQTHNHVSEGRARFAAALAEAPQPSIARAKALNGAGFLARCQHELVQAQELLEESISLFQQLGDQRGAAHALNNLGTVAVDQYDYERAVSLCSESLAISRRLGDRMLCSWALTNLGHLAALRYNYAESARLYAESLALFQELGARRGIAHAISNLARIAYLRYDYAEAEERYHEAITIFRALDDRHSAGQTLLSLADVALAQDKLAYALDLIEQGQAMLRALGNKQSLGMAIALRGQIAELQDSPEQARSYYQESLAMFRLVGDQSGAAKAILGMSNALLMRGDSGMARQWLNAYVALASELRQPRMLAVGICIRDAVDIASSTSTAIVQLETDLAQFQAEQNEWGVGIALHMLGIALLRLGHLDRAQACYMRSLAIAYESNDACGIPMRLMGLAAVALGQGRSQDAIRLGAAAEAARQTFGVGQVSSAMITLDRDQYAATTRALAAASGSTLAQLAAALPHTSSAEAALENAFGPGAVQYIRSYQGEQLPAGYAPL
ncbi:XRE family transcriptional regulator [Chloroflexia bacterium SDU3-3]|nr:XRE family transcriptional regulator [Chloroflexia bacterium SDU3-3]